MTPEQFEILQKAAGLLVAVIGTVGLVPAVNWLKARLSIDGGRAQVLAAAVSVLVAIVSLIASGDLNLETVLSEQFIAILLLVWAASQQIYKRLMAQEEPIVIPPDGMPTEAMVEAAVDRYIREAGGVR